MNASDLVHQLTAMRTYTNMVLADIRDDDWYRFPEHGFTNIAWQVGHMTVAEYGLALKAVRGPCESDSQIILQEILDSFGRGTQPTEEPLVAVADLRNSFEAVHAQVLQEVPSFSEDLLDQEVAFEHPLFETKRNALLWCAHHEMTHAGQIALLRRMLGYDIRF